MSLFMGWCEVFDLSVTLCVPPLLSGEAYDPSVILRMTSFPPETGTLLSLRDISPNREITFQGRQELFFIFSLILPRLKEKVARSDGEVEKRTRQAVSLL